MPLIGSATPVGVCGANRSYPRMCALMINVACAAYRSSQNGFTADNGVNELDVVE